MNLYYKISVIFIFCLVANLTYALTHEDELNAISINIVLDKTESELKRKVLRFEMLDGYYKQLKSYRIWSVTCISENKVKLSTLTVQSEVLGERVSGETLSVAKKRTDLLKEKSNIKKFLATCNVILLRVDELNNKINIANKNLIATQLLTYGPNIYQLILENWNKPSIWSDAVKIVVLKNSGLLKLAWFDLFILVFLLLITVLISRYYSRILSSWRNNHKVKDLLASQLACALATSTQHYIMIFPVIFVAIIYMNILDFNTIPTPFIVIVLNGFGIVILLNAIIHFFLNSSLLIYQYKPRDRDKAVELVRRLKALVLLIFIGILLFSTLFFHKLPEEVLFISRAIFGTILVLNLIWIIWLMGYFHQLGNKVIVRVVLTLVFIVALAAELIGYRELSLYIIEVIVGTLLILGIYSVLSKLISEFMDNLDNGNIPMALRFRNWLGVRDGQHIQGLIWIRLIISVSMWLGLISILILIWQIPDTYVELLLIKIIDGFTLGPVQLIPLNVFEAVIVFSIILVINSWFKRRLEKNWLPKTAMTRSARESIVTMCGYFGVLIALIVALGFIGLDFSNVALIAGALSVGIGFGLQNVVNNFISGLILLFERPIKTGDWIIVGTTEGHVKKISIRSTHIQTFDRADVIVPNSEIISGTVTNWMLRDHSGRIRVPIGVAYGSDTELVRDLLLQVAIEHSDVITENKILSKPTVLFMSFGDSCLDFELRCYIYNIDKRRSTISDLNFAIDKIFRKNNIEIPFPQRDLNIKNDFRDNK